MGTHKHHIIPRYMGGSDEPENLIELTVEEHAEAHRVLYEKHGNWQDRLAWQCLTGQIATDDIRRTKTVLTWTGRRHTEETKEKIREARKNQQSSGWKWSEESKKKQSESHSGKTLTEEHKKNISKSNKSKNVKDIISCPHCGKEGQAAAMYRWHFNNCKKKE